MGQRYIRSVSTSGGLSIPVVEGEILQCNAAYATQTFTYAASGRLEILVEDAEAECQLYNGTSWNTGDVPLVLGLNKFDSNHQGVRVRNRGAVTAPVSLATIVSYTT